MIKKILLPNQRHFAFYNGCRNNLMDIIWGKKGMLVNSLLWYYCILQQTAPRQKCIEKHRNGRTKWRVSHAFIQPHASCLIKHNKVFGLVFTSVHCLPHDTAYPVKFLDIIRVKHWFSGRTNTILLPYINNSSCHVLLKNTHLEGMSAFIKIPLSHPTQYQKYHLFKC